MGEEEQRRGRPRDRDRQNKQVQAAVRRHGLTKDEHDVLKRELEHLNRDLGENLGFHEVQDLAEQLVRARRRP